MAVRWILEAPEDEPPDEDLIARYRQGDEEAINTLLARYRNFARVKARPYFLVGADRDDIVQEGLIGLYKAIRDFRPGRQATFRGFAGICVTRQIITAIKAATRLKHTPLNSYVSLSRPVVAVDEAERVLMDILPSVSDGDPAEDVIGNDELDASRLAFSEILSAFEAAVLGLYLGGMGYQEIADRVSRGVKSVDNALQRVKRKIELHLRGRAARENEAGAPVGAASTAARG